MPSSNPLKKPKRTPTDMYTVTEVIEYEIDASSLEEAKELYSQGHGETKELIFRKNRQIVYVEKDELAASKEQPIHKDLTRQQIIDELKQNDLDTMDLNSMHAFVSEVLEDGFDNPYKDWNDEDLIHDYEYYIEGED